MSGNSFGEIFRITTFGESHGPALGVVIDGVPAGLFIDRAFIQSELDRRKPGQSKLATARSESDQVEILSGTLDDIATGTALAMLIRNCDQHSKDYTALANLFRPGHADYSYFKKYGIRDARGGGRSSGRETAARVAAGAVAKLFLARIGVNICAWSQEISGVTAKSFDPAEIEKNPARSPDPQAAEAMIRAATDAARDQDSTGGVVACQITGVPAGWGEPVFDKLDAMLAHAMLSLGSVKGIEFGNGFAAAALRGSENNDPLAPDQEPPFTSNNSGGILGGISNGSDITFRIAVKPTPSIARPQQTINCSGNAETISIAGRHDPCIVPRIVPVVEAMAAIVLADAALRQRCVRVED